MPNWPQIDSGSACNSFSHPAASTDQIPARSGPSQCTVVALRSKTTCPTPDCCYSGSRWEYRSLRQSGKLSGPLFARSAGGQRVTAALHCSPMAAIPTIISGPPFSSLAPAESVRFDHDGQNVSEEISAGCLLFLENSFLFSPFALSFFFSFLHSPSVFVPACFGGLFFETQFRR